MYYFINNFPVTKAVIFNESFKTGILECKALILWVFSCSYMVRYIYIVLLLQGW